MDRRDLTALLREHASRHSVPEAAIGILREGEVTTACYGVAPDARFRVGSLTKSMVATAIARLADAGRLSLEDPIASRVPEVRESGWAKSATLRDLLANRSGLPLRNELEFGFDRYDALSRLVSGIPLHIPTAGFWSYSNVGWCLLGRVIETVTDTAWQDAMRFHLFANARMHETTFAPDAVGRAYAPAGTTVVSTVEDLVRFAALHLDDASLAAFREVHADISIYGWFDSWCLGWAFFDWHGGHVWGWDGLIGDARSVLRLMPERHAAVVLLTNSSAGRAMYRSLFADLMQPLCRIDFPPLRLDPAAGATVDLACYAGVYAWPDRRVEVTATADGLLIKSERGETEALPLDERTFLVDAANPDNPTVTFGAFDPVGRPRVLYLMVWGLPRVA